jgi:hypothetical protein
MTTQPPSTAFAQADPMIFSSTPDATAVPCVRLGLNRIMARMKLSTVLRLTSDPLKTEKHKERGSDYRLQQAYSMRRIVQREFIGIKSRNVPTFAQYLLKVTRNEIAGLAPAMKLYCPGPVQVQENPDGTAMAYISSGDELVAYDGETQLAAWYRVLAENPELRDTVVAIDLSFERPLEWARQVWHDVNVFGSRPNAALSLSMDARDPINQVVEALQFEIPFYKGQVNRMKRQLKPGDGYFTLTTFRGACVTLTKGISGVALGMKPVPGLNPEDLEQIREVAVEYFNAVAGTIGEAIKNPRMLANSPAVWVAIGALGHDLLKVTDPTVRAARISTIMASLSEVNWTKGHHWAGIAGKVTTSTTPAGAVRERFALAGPKEVAYNVFKALTDPKNAGYASIRNPKATALDEARGEAPTLDLAEA